MTSFSAQVSGYVAQYKERLIAVRNQSAQDVFVQATTPRAQGGNMRVDTGFLRSSAVVTTGSPVAINPSARPQKGVSYNLNLSTSVGAIATAGLQDPLYIRFTASYAGVRESKDAFVRLAAQNWQEIVRKNVEALQSQ